MTRKVVRDDPDEKNGTRCPGTRWFWRDKSRNQNGTLLACFAPVKAEVRNKPDEPIYVLPQQATQKVKLVLASPFIGIKRSNHVWLIYL